MASGSSTSGSMVNSEQQDEDDPLWKYVTELEKAPVDGVNWTYNYCP